MTVPVSQSLWKLKSFLLYPESHLRMCLLSFPCSFVIHFPCCCELVWHYRNGAGWIILHVGFFSLLFHTVLKAGVYVSAEIHRLWKRAKQTERRDGDGEKLSQFVGKVLHFHSSVGLYQGITETARPQSWSPLFGLSSRCSICWLPVWLYSADHRRMISKTTADPFLLLSA